MLSRTLVAVAALAATIVASPCTPRPTGAPVPVLPTTGAADLPAPNAGSKLRAIAVGHGIQNYTCANGSATAAAAGALAVLYDVTDLYPGMSANSLSKEDFDGLTDKVLWTQDIPLNLIDPAAAKPGTKEKPNGSMPPSAYGGTSSPFVSATDLKVDAGIPDLKFLGHHYFDAAGSPTFDLSAKNLRFSVGLKQAVDAPATADKGIMSTGAVKWLVLNDNGKGLSTVGPSAQVYRVITIGGVQQACSVEGAVPVGSVPYTAFYWFYG